MLHDDATSREIHQALATPCAEAAPEEGAHVCPACRLPFVMPTEAVEVDEWHFAVGLHCANCDWVGGGVYDDEALERFDIGLDDATRALAAALDSIAAAIAREELERFVAALAVGAILPEDFGPPRVT